MTFFRTATVASLAVAAGLSAAVLAAPAQADPVNDQFLNDRFLTDLSGIGLLGIDPAAATSLGQQVCPMLAEPGQNVADVAAKVADEMGRPLGPATMSPACSPAWRSRSSARARSLRWPTVGRPSRCPESRR